VQREDALEFLQAEERRAAEEQRAKEAAQARGGGAGRRSGRAPEPVLEGVEEEEGMGED
jgi:hypothetical protein